jgi:hypothetical protein
MRAALRRSNAQQAPFIALGISNDAAGWAAGRNHRKKLRARRDRGKISARTVSNKEGTTMQTESASLAITIEGLAAKISRWHAEETALRKQMDLTDESPVRDRIESEADGLAEKIIGAEDHVSWIPAKNAKQAYLKIILTAWRADLDEKEDRDLIKRVLMDTAAFLQPMAGISAEEAGLGDWLDP